MVKNVQEPRRILASLKETCAGNTSRTVSGFRSFGSKAGEGLGCVVSSAVVRSPKHRRDRTVLLQEQGRKQEMPDDNCKLLWTLKSHIHLCSVLHTAFRNSKIECGRLIE